MPKYNNIEALEDIISFFADANISKNFILVGSWCEFFYQEMLLGYLSEMRTKDFDFYCDDENFSDARAQVPKGLRESGFWYDEDMGGKSILYNLNNDSVEFLASYSRAGRELANFKEIGIKAERLPYLDIYKNHNVSTEGILAYGDIRIPTPAAYVMHKIIIHDDRTPEKQEKDDNAVHLLLRHFRPEDREEMRTIYNELGKKTRKKFERNARSIGLDFDFLSGISPAKAKQSFPDR